MPSTTSEADRRCVLERFEAFVRRHRSSGAAGLCPCQAAPVSLTVSRQCGARLSRIEKPLLEYLDSLCDGDGAPWALFDRGLVGKLLEDSRFGREFRPFRAADAKFPVPEQLIAGFSGKPEEWTFFHHSVNLVRNLCHIGHVVIVGRAGNFVTADLPNTFHVRLVADKGHRVAGISARLGIGTPESTEWIEETDKARARFVKRHTGGEIDDPAAYHLVISTGLFSDECLVRVIGDSFHEWSQNRPAAMSHSAMIPFPGPVRE